MMKKIKLFVELEYDPDYIGDEVGQDVFFKDVLQGELNLFSPVIDDYVGEITVIEIVQDKTAA